MIQTDVTSKLLFYPRSELEFTVEDKTRARADGCACWAWGWFTREPSHQIESDRRAETRNGPHLQRLLEWNPHQFDFPFASTPPSPTLRDPTLPFPTSKSSQDPHGIISLASA